MHPNGRNKQGYLMKMQVTKPSSEPFTVYFYKFYNFRHSPLPIDTGLSTTLEALFDTPEKTKTDHMFLNFGHYNLVEEETEAFTAKANDLITETIDRAKKMKIPVTYLSHPPSHFNTEDGSYVSRASTQAQCSCDVKNLEKQYIWRHDAVVQTLVTAKDAHFIDYWHDMSAQCNSHRGSLPGGTYDCLHYKLSPTSFKKAITGMAAEL